MLQIVKSKNDYYILDDDQFYGHFHSIAEAEYQLKNLQSNRKLRLREPLQNYSFVKNIFY